MNNPPHLPIINQQCTVYTVQCILFTVSCLLSIVCCLLSINTRHLSSEIPRTLKFISSAMFLFTKFNINLISEPGRGIRLL